MSWPRSTRLRDVLNPRNLMSDTQLPPTTAGLPVESAATLSLCCGPRSSSAAPCCAHRRVPMRDLDARAQRVSGTKHRATSALPPASGLSSGPAPGGNRRPRMADHPTRAAQRDRGVGRSGQRATRPGGQPVCVDRRPRLAGDGLPHGLVWGRAGSSGSGNPPPSSAPANTKATTLHHQHRADGLAAEPYPPDGRLAAGRVPVTAGMLKPASGTRPSPSDHRRPRDAPCSSFP